MNWTGGRLQRYSNASISSKMLKTQPKWVAKSQQNLRSRRRAKDPKTSFRSLKKIQRASRSDSLRSRDAAPVVCSAESGSQPVKCSLGTSESRKHSREAHVDCDHVLSQRHSDAIVEDLYNATPPPQTSKYNDNGPSYQIEGEVVNKKRKILQRKDWTGINTLLAASSRYIQPKWDSDIAKRRKTSGMANLHPKKQKSRSSLPTALRLTNKHISSEPRSLVPRREDIDIVIGYDDFTTETILPSSSCSARSNQILPSQSIKDSTAGSSDVMLLDSNNSIGHVTSNDDDKVNGGSRFFPQPSSAVYEPAHFLKGLQRHSCNIKHATPHTTSDYSLESVPSKYDATRVIHEEYLPLRSDLTSTNLALHHPVPVRRSRLIGSEALHNYSFAIGKKQSHVSSRVAEPSLWQTSHSISTELCGGPRSRGRTNSDICRSLLCDSTIGAMDISERDGHDMHRATPVALSCRLTCPTFPFSLEIPGSTTSLIAMAGSAENNTAFGRPRRTSSQSGESGRLSTPKKAPKKKENVHVEPPCFKKYSNSEELWQRFVFGDEL